MGQRKPSWPFWVLAGVLVIGGPVTGGVLLYTGLRGYEQEMIRVVAPGAEDIDLDEAGDYTVYHLHRATHRGKIYNQVPGGVRVQLELKRASDGTPIAITGNAVSSNFEYMETEGTAIRQFSIDRPGRYVLQADAENEVVLGITNDSIFKMIGSTLGACCGVPVVGFALAGVAIARLVRGRKARREAGAGAAPGAVEPGADDESPYRQT